MFPECLPHVELVTAHVADEDEDVLMLLLRVALQVGHHRKHPLAIRTRYLQYNKQPVRIRALHLQRTEQTASATQ